MDNAIRKAMDGGWHPDYTIDPLWFASGDDKASKALMLMDVTFWKCLGIKLSWHEGQWLKQWHLFVDHIAAGKDVDKYFNELLK